MVELGGDHLKINNKEIGRNLPPYIVAEMSANHNQDIDNAYKIIYMAKQAGADAVKLQTYKPDTITMDMKTPEFMIDSGLWAGKSLYELYESAFTPWEWHKPLFDYAHKIGITIFSSPFDTTAVDLLEDLNVPAYKIASFEAIDLPLIRYVAQTEKPMIISTGMANSEEIREAVNTAQEGGCREIAILHCVSEYPALAEDYNLKTISDMQQKFGIVVGLSDHTIDNTIAISSVTLGASIIEKHVTLDRNGGGPDDSFSLEPEELKTLCSSARDAYNSLGKVDYTVKSGEKDNIKFRRSLYSAKDIRKNTIITEDQVKSIRPGYGLHPKYIDRVIGSKAVHDIVRGTPISFDLIM